MKWLKEIAVQKRLNNRLLHQNLKQLHIPDEFRHIGILANSAEDFRITKEFIRNKWGYKIRITGLYFDDKEPDSIEAFSHKHFNIIGQPSHYFNEFCSEKMDFILVPSLKLNPYLRYLLLANNSGFNIGFYSKENRPFLDLMLEIEEKNLEYNIENLINYLNKIKAAC
ncbi:DUF6913 domain-containing protein [Shivajiella indica]|uniref:DUF6913 domain-containing protein n=1 Tax=Shivajiella indica TaxID=872115 RepID=A0ABW5BBK1_9BACT